MAEADNRAVGMLFRNHLVDRGNITQYGRPTIFKGKNSFRAVRGMGMAVATVIGTFIGLKIGVSVPTEFLAAVLGAIHPTG